MMTFSEPTRVTAQYRIVTPMFLGGEGHQADEKQFRNASLKGALRFWWRALNWGQALKDANGNTEMALRSLHTREGHLFGQASDGKDSQQSQVYLQSELQGAKLKNPGKGLEQIGYLLGQGLFHFRDGILREYLEGGRLDLTLQFKPGATADTIASVKSAAIALGLFGGLGSRARKGLGSLAIETMGHQGQAMQRFTTLESVQAFIDSLDFSVTGDVPLTALSQGSRIDVSLTDTTALGALAKVDEEMQMYRSYGKDGKVNGKGARRNFVLDHDLAMDASQGKTISHLPKRGVFGLPHNYFFSSTKGKADMTTEGQGRRASPLFIHVHALENKQFAAIQTLLPAVFLRNDMRVEIKTGRGTQSLPSPNVDYAVIHDYLNGFGQRKTLKGNSRG